MRHPRRQIERRARKPHRLLERSMMHTARTLCHRRCPREKGLPPVFGRLIGALLTADILPPSNGPVPVCRCFGLRAQRRLLFDIASYMASGRVVLGEALPVDGSLCRGLRLVLRLSVEEHIGPQTCRTVVPRYVHSTHSCRVHKVRTPSR